MIDCIWLPKLEICTNLSAWAIHEENLYNIFKNDFINTQPIYLEKTVKIREYLPKVNGKEEAFYHVTCKKYSDVSDRDPDLRRSERIRWIRAFIENKCNIDLCNNCTGIKIWEEPARKGTSHSRIHILLEEEKYVVIIEKRPNYYLLITAFYYHNNHSLRKALSKYEKYKETENASQSETSPETPSTTSR